MTVSGGVIAFAASAAEYRNEWGELRKRGRPPKEHALTPAERQHAYRERQRAKADHPWPANDDGRQPEAPPPSSEGEYGREDAPPEVRHVVTEALRSN